MLNQTESKPLNTQEVKLPNEVNRNTTRILPPAVMSKSPMDLPAEHFSESLVRRENNRSRLLNWIKSNLQPGIDFGQIHVMGKEKCRLARDGRANECMEPRHWSKSSLWKPGAEKICGLLGLIPRFPNLSEYENAAMKGMDIKAIILKCELHTGNGFIAAEGTGARLIAQDNGDINKSIKMAEKSAHIDATLRLAGLSELFTQDIEDMLSARQDIQPDTNGNRPEQNQYQTDQKRQPERESNGQGYGGGRISSKQYKFILDLLENAEMTIQQINTHCIQVYGSALDYINRIDASSLIDWLKSQKS